MMRRDISTQQVALGSNGALGAQFNIKQYEIKELNNQREDHTAASSCDVMNVAMTHDSLRCQEEQGRNSNSRHTVSSTPHVFSPNVTFESSSLSQRVYPTSQAQFQPSMPAFGVHSLSPSGSVASLSVNRGVPRAMCALPMASEFPPVLCQEPIVGSAEGSRQYRPTSHAQGGTLRYTEDAVPSSASSSSSRKSSIASVVFSTNEDDSQRRSFQGKAQRTKPTAFAPGVKRRDGQQRDSHNGSGSCSARVCSQHVSAESSDGSPELARAESLPLALSHAKKGTVKSKAGKSRHRSTSNEEDIPHKPKDGESESVDKGSIDFARCDISPLGGAAKNGALVTPVENCELHPLIIIRDENGKHFDDDDPSPENPVGRKVRIRYRWQCGPSRAVCTFHPAKPAHLQCTNTLRCFCSQYCFLQGFQQLRQFYFSRGQYDIPSHPNPYTYGVRCQPKPGVADDHNFDQYHLRELRSTGLLLSDSEAELMWHDVSEERNYVPTKNDVGHQLRFEATLEEIPSDWDQARMNSEVSSESAPAPCPSGDVVYNSENPSSPQCCPHRDSQTVVPVHQGSWAASGEGKGGRRRSVEEGSLGSTVCPEQEQPSSDDSCVPTEQLSSQTGRGNVLDKPMNVRVVTGCVVPHIQFSDSRRLLPVPRLDAHMKLIRAPPPVEGMQFTIMSWNCLAEVYATTEQFPSCDPCFLSWQYRRARLLETVRRFNADILLLQEIQSDHYQGFFLPELRKLGYEGFYKQKTREIFSGSGKRRGGKYIIDGCASFYKVSKFNLVEIHAVEFSSLIQKTFQTSTTLDHDKQTVSKRLLKDNVALALLLEVRTGRDDPPANYDLRRESSIADPYNTSTAQKFGTASVSHGAFRSLGHGIVHYRPVEYCTGPIFLATNTHILANPGANDVKIWQAQTLINFIREYVNDIRSRMQQYSLPNNPKDPDNIGVIIAGDFNSTPDSTVYQLFTRGFCDIDHEDFTADVHGLLSEVTLSHDAKLRSASAMASLAVQVVTHGGSTQRRALSNHEALDRDMAAYEPAWTNFTHNFIGCLDYVFYNDAVMSVTRMLEMLTKERFEKECDDILLPSRFLPSALRPSDHLPLMFSFCFNDP